ncbi:MAG: hypothetical protein JW724_01440 [Candidatus Altiarchaeota archaeon]|nr:hypothetical protein [Candidatus Altiarchaeota archaeon]
MDDEHPTLMSLVFNKGLKKKKEQKNPPGAKLLPYKTVMCRHCGRIQVTTGEEMFRCRGCNKVIRFRKRGLWNVRLMDYRTFEEAHIAAKRWAMEEGVQQTWQA